MACPDNFWHFSGFSDRKLDLQRKKVLIFVASFSREITESFRQIEIKINDLCEHLLYEWLHGYIQPSSSALSST